MTNFTTWMNSALKDSQKRAYASFLQVNSLYALARGVGQASAASNFQDGTTKFYAKKYNLTPEGGATAATTVWAARRGWTVLSFVRHSTKTWNERWYVPTWETKNGQSQLSYKFQGSQWSVDRVVASGAGKIAKEYYTRQYSKQLGEFLEQTKAAKQVDAAIDVKKALWEFEANYTKKYLRINGANFGVYSGAAEPNVIKQAFTRHINFKPVTEVKVIDGVERTVIKEGTNFGSAGKVARVAGSAFKALVNMVGIGYSVYDLTADAQKTYSSTASQVLTLMADSLCVVGNILGCFGGPIGWAGDVILGAVSTILSTVNWIISSVPPPPMDTTQAANQIATDNPDYIVSVSRDSTVSSRKGSRADADYLNYVYAGSGSASSVAVRNITYDDSGGKVNSSVIFGHGNRSINGGAVDEKFILSGLSDVNDFNNSDEYVANEFIARGQQHDATYMAATISPGANNGTWDGGGGVNTLSVNYEALGTGIKLVGNEVFARQAQYLGWRYNGVDQGTGTADMRLVTWQNFQNFEGTKYSDIFDFSTSNVTNGVLVDAGKGLDSASDDQDSVTGTAYDDVIFVHGVGDTVRGGDGDDVVNLTGGLWTAAYNPDRQSSLIGGNGLDTLSLESFGYARDDVGKISIMADRPLVDVKQDADPTLRIDLANGTLAIAQSSVVSPTTWLASFTTTLSNYSTFATITGFELFQGSLYKDEFIGSASDDQLSGNDGDDTLQGNGGNDLLFGGDGDDKLDGGDGDDSLHDGFGMNNMYGGAGDDWFYIEGRMLPALSYIPDANRPAAGHLATDKLYTTIYGDRATGTDSLDFEQLAVYGAGQTLFTYDLADPSINDQWMEIGTAKAVAQKQQTGKTSPIQQAVSMTLTQDEVLKVDLYRGWARLQDVGVADLGEFTVNGSGDGASLTRSTQNFDVTYDVANFSGIQNVVGSTSGRNWLIGDQDGNKLTGGAGNDTLDGWDGDDVLQGGAGADRLVGGTGTDWAVYSTSWTGVHIELGLASEFIVAEGGDAEGDTADHVENLAGSYYADRLIGAKNWGNVLAGNGTAASLNLIRNGTFDLVDEEDNGWVASGDGNNFDPTLYRKFGTSTSGLDVDAVHGEGVGVLADYQRKSNGQSFDGISNGTFDSNGYNGTTWSRLVSPLKTETQYGLGDHGHANVGELVGTTIMAPQPLNDLRDGEVVVIEFDYARRADIANDDGIAAYWNGEMVWFDDDPSRSADPATGWSRQRMVLYGVEGTNFLSFSGLDANATSGVLIDNVTRVAAKRPGIAQTIQSLAAGEAVTLSFQYSNTIDSYPYNSQATKGIEVYWNGVKVFADASQDSGWKTKSLNLVAKDGDNVLEFRDPNANYVYNSSSVDIASPLIDNVWLAPTLGDYLKGSGQSDMYLVQADDVGPVLIDLDNDKSVATTDVLRIFGVPLNGRNFLVRQPTEPGNRTNLLTNGNFESSATGWTVTGPAMEVDHPAADYWLPGIGHGDRVTELDSTGNTAISQVINGITEGEKVAVEFDYALRNHTGAAGSGIEVYWNGALVWSNVDPSMSWNHTKLILTGQATTGSITGNTLQIKSIGPSDGLGVVLDNVSAYKSSLIVNGSFEAGSAGWTVTGPAMEVSYAASVYGLSNSGHGTKVTELDSTDNNTISQTITGLQQGDHVKISFDYSQRPGASTDNGIEVYWNGQKIFSDKPTTTSWIRKELEVTAVDDGSGLNKLEFRSTGPSDTVGVILDNVEAHREDLVVTRMNNLLPNGDFEQGTVGWTYTMVPAGGFLAYDTETVSSNGATGHGSQVGVLAGTQTGTISYRPNTMTQEISGLVAGETVAIDFDFLSGLSNINKSVSVYWNDQLLGTGVATANWQTKRVVATATGGADRLTFQTQGDAVSVLIDNVAVYAASNKTEVQVDGYGRDTADGLAMIVPDNGGSDQGRGVQQADIDQLIQASSSFTSTDSWLRATDAQLNAYGTTVQSVLTGAPLLQAA